MVLREQGPAAMAVEAEVAVAPPATAGMVPSDRGPDVVLAAGAEAPAVMEATAAEEARLPPARHRPPAEAAVGVGRRSATRPLTK